ncbi:unnamed protein product [Adineta steineri]|uniref:MAM domain-containing protein n=1 Tax=Adineta steineri TaxID=433720 RepID=A0A814EZ11_9BILA|nr:unnamed protein product [Adineta steineri]CAF4184894.1 unnamed protein product [Adineta steineri]
MWQFFHLFYFICIFISFTHTQVLYQCNFDGINGNCFMSTLNPIGSVNVAGPSEPNGALSDVSAIVKPTANGEMCVLPYKVGNFTWDMYFCNRGYCPTASSPNSTCASGRFGNIALNNNQTRKFQLKTETGGINGKDQQCLTYYYYMGNVGQKIINIRKEEVDGGSVIIDSVTNSPFNGWILRRISFNAEALGYKIYFEVQGTSSTGAPNVGLDEISIHQDRCGDEPITVTPITTTTTISTLTATSTTTTTSISQQTTPITTTLKTSAIAIVDNVVISSYEKIPPREKSHIIVMATVIPIVWIAFIITLVWMRRSTGVLSGVFNRFPNWSRSGESSGSYELTTVSET